MPGFLSALTGKITGLGTVARAAVVTTVAVAMVVGGAGAVLSLPDNGVDAAVVVPAAVDQPAATVTVEAPAATVASPAPAPAAAAEPAPAPAASARATAPAASAAASADLPALPKAPKASARKAPTAAAADIPTPTLPALPAIPGCLSELIPTSGTMPDPVELATQLPSCILSLVMGSVPLDLIRSVLDSANLPVDIFGCLSSVLSAVPTFATGDLSRLPQLLTACMPTGDFSGMGSMSARASMRSAG